jgi:hypothetical protein
MMVVAHPFTAIILGIKKWLEAPSHSITYHRRRRNFLLQPLAHSLLDINQHKTAPHQQENGLQKLVPLWGFELNFFNSDIFRTRTKII